MSVGNWLEVLRQLCRDSGKGFSNQGMRCKTAQLDDVSMHILLNDCLIKTLLHMKGATKVQTATLS